MIILKSPEEIQKIKAAGDILAECFEQVAQILKPGVSTLTINQAVDRTIRKHGAVATCIGYGDPPYPTAACVSVNEEVVHGIPSADRPVQDGDIVSVDVVCSLDGYNADACRTFLCGSVTPEVEALVRITEEAFWLAAKEAKVGRRLGDLAALVQNHCERHGLGIVRELSGHGIGRDMHEDPEVLNYGRPGTGLRLQAGMVICLEPMVTLGSPQIAILDDGWTIVTQDGKPASHYENTLAITEDGPLILTCPERRHP